MSVDGLNAADTGEARGGRRGVMTCNLILGCLHQSTQISLTAAIRAIAVVEERRVILTGLSGAQSHELYAVFMSRTKSWASN